MRVWALPPGVSWQGRDSDASFPLGGPNAPALCQLKRWRAPDGGVERADACSLPLRPLVMLIRPVAFLPGRCAQKGLGNVLRSVRNALGGPARHGTTTPVPLRNRGMSLQWRWRGHNLVLGHSSFNCRAFLSEHPLKPSQFADVGSGQDPLHGSTRCSRPCPIHAVLEALPIRFLAALSLTASTYSLGLPTGNELAFQ